MTVKELIAKLEEMPQNSKVYLEIITFNDNFCEDIEEVFEDTANKICIQGY